MGNIEMTDVGKRYGNVEVLRNINLQVKDGEFLVLVGPSGCGKSTLLRMIAGLEDISTGTIAINARVVNHISARARDVAMIFQNYALYPHMTVAENIVFSLKISNVAKSERNKRLQKVAETLELKELLDRKPKALSGGQRQRVAMGRAIIRKPSVFLMDEPLSNLDAKLRVQMRTELRNLHKRLGITTVYVTHDQTEALTLGDRVVVMSPLGEAMETNIQQVAEPGQLFRHPDNVFVAGFIGSPAMNLLLCDLVKTDGVATVRIADADIRVPTDVLKHRPTLASFFDKKVIVGLRPTDFTLEHGQGDTINWIVDDTELLGEEVSVTFAPPVPKVFSDFEFSDSSDTLASSSKTLAHVIARVSAAAHPKIGTKMELGVAADRMHFFDPNTGQSIRYVAVGEEGQDCSIVPTLMPSDGRKQNGSC